MITRRTVLGAGMAFTAAACTAGFGAYRQTTRRRSAARSTDALLIDETIQLPPQLAALVSAGRRTLPVLGIQFSAAAHAELTRVLSSSQSIIGISSGATLFCLERIAWDHGFRLTARSQRCIDDLGSDTCWQDVMALLNGRHDSSASPSAVARVYRPSRADGTIHTWAMQKDAGPQIRQSLREEV